MNYALVFWGIGLAAILFVENAVSWWSWTALIFLTYWGPWTLVLVSIVIWMAIWYWIKSFMTEDDTPDENDF